MENFVFYLIRSSIYLLVFGLFYGLFFRNVIHIRFQRIFILAAIGLSLLLALPGKFILLNVPDTGGSEILTINLPEFVVNGQAGFVAAESRILEWFSHYTLIFILPISAGIFFIFRFLFAVLRIKDMIRKNPKKKVGDIMLVTLKGDQSPFSFFHWVFVPSQLMQTSHFEKVLDHEKAHVRFGHSFDIVFMEVVRLFFWYHPVWYFLKKELQTLHEFEADNFVLREHPLPSYQDSLLQFAWGSEYLPVTNPFNFSMIKKRILMMKKPEKNRASSFFLRMLGVMPLLAIAFAFQTLSLQALQPFNHETPMYVIDGVITDNEAVKLISPGNIESVEIIKGASAIEVYGQSAENGVVVIKTKSGTVPVNDTAGESSEARLSFSRVDDGPPPAQNPEQLQLSRDEHPSPKEDVVFTDVDENPEFKGGMEKLIQFLTSNLKYPEEAKAAGVQGTVFVSFIVEKDGAITDARILRGVNTQLDEEALRVVKLMPPFNPAKLRGEAVRAQFNLPIRFVLSQ